MIKAAGIVFSVGGKVLLMRRGLTAPDYPGYWDLPGGTTEGSETPEVTAIREALEESGRAPSGPLVLVGKSVMDGVEYTTFLDAGGTDYEVPVFSDEHIEFGWFALGETPQSLGLAGEVHPGVSMALDTEVVLRTRLMQMTETDVARAVANGSLPSPTRFSNVHMFAVRITGTGTAYRAAEGNGRGEYVYRPPENYLTEEFLARCLGLPVIFEHPKKKFLDSQEFKDRVVGTIVFAYIVGDEVWGVARIYDEDTVTLLTKEQMSTSPTVVFRDNSENNTISLEDGSVLLVEGKPCLLDHLAICYVGVWDKGGIPAGVISQPVEGTQMNEDEKKAAEAVKADAQGEVSRADAVLTAISEKLDKCLSRQDSIDERLNAMDKARADSGGEKIEKKEEEIKEVKADNAPVKADTDGKPEAEPEGGATRADSQRRALSPELAARLADLESRVPAILSDSDLVELSNAQARADSVAQSFGETAPRPLMGETPLSYRKRLASRYKAYSKDYKDINVSAIADSALFAVAESRIYADAQAAANAPQDVPAGQLVPRVSRDSTGRQITSFTGDIGVFTGQFSLPARRVAGFTTKGN